MPGPGVDFTNLQAAVDACSGGDIVLVRSGNYASFLIVGKGITVVEDVGHTVVVQGETLVQGTPAGATVGLVGLQFNLPLETGTSRGLVLTGNAGAVLVQSCVFHGRTPAFPTLEHGRPAIEITSTAQALFLGCEMRGGRGGLGNTGGTAGGAGVRANASALTFYGCNASGGPGGSAQDDSEDPGGPGGDGIALTGGSFAFLSGTYSSGGNGGEGDGNGFECGDGGDGGDGLDLSGGLAVAIASSYTGGVGGPTLFCSSGANGLAVRNPAALTTLTDALPRLTMPPLVREGQAPTITVNGAPGSTASLLVSRHAAPAWHPELSGVLLAPNGARVLDLGTIPASGEIQATLPRWRLPAGLEGATLGFQLEAVLPGGTVRISKPTHVVVLRAGL